MGLLDDAIREHLELKRRHGANPEDVARQEQEALGPSRRGEFAQPDDAAEGPGAVQAPDPPAAEPEPGEPEPAEGPVAEVGPAAESALAGEVEPAAQAAPAAGVEPVSEAGPAAEAGLAEPVTADAGPEPPYQVQPAEPGAVPAVEAPTVEAPTAEAPVEGVPPGYEEDPWLPDEPEESSPAGEASAEDVLEETPDFLQETPEHDRLWFEQKPPRNFDWDK